MSINQEGLTLIKRFEGLHLSAYLDPVGIWTIGYGHIGAAAREGAIMSESEAEQLLQADLAIAQRAVNRLITIALNANQHAALVSFTFNLGAGSLQRSSLRAKLNRGESESAAAEFPRWVYAGGRIWPGLVKRRAAEMELFLTLPVTKTS